MPEIKTLYSLNQEDYFELDDLVEKYEESEDFDYDSESPKTVYLDVYELKFRKTTHKDFLSCFDIEMLIEKTRENFDEQNEINIGYLDDIDELHISAIQKIILNYLNSEIEQPRLLLPIGKEKKLIYRIEY